MLLCFVDDNDDDECEHIVFKTVYVKMMCISLTGHTQINDIFANEMTMSLFVE